MTAKVSKKNSFSTLSYQVLWLGSGIRPPRTIPLGPKMLDADDPKMTTMIETYRRGFNKGIAAQTAAFINSENH